MMREAGGYDSDFVKVAKVLIDHLRTEGDKDEEGDDSSKEVKEEK